jgi:hypothetical protein
MRPLEELIDRSEPGIELVKSWVASATVECQILERSDKADEALLNLQVTTRSPLGAVAHETGGILIQEGWLRILGSGNPSIPRRIDRWNQGRSSGYLLVADDAVGGFFALNGGAFGDDLGQVYYLAPDDLDWLALDVGYSEFLQAMLSGRIDSFYKDLRWDGWKDDLQALTPDSSFIFYPFLWTREGSIGTASRSTAPVSDVFDFKADAIR